MVSNGPNGPDHRKPSRRSRFGGADRASDYGGDMVSVTIPSDFAASRDLQKTIVDQVVACGYNSQNVFAIKLALEEAMINAIKHGNKLDMKKHVHIGYAVSPTTVEIVIEDEGPGFTREEIPDPTLEENLTKCSGRGILLIEAYMTRVEYSKGGRRLRMIKENEADVLPRKK